MQHELGVGVNPGPGPDVPDAEHALKVRGRVRPFAVAERLNFVALNPLGFQVRHALIVEPLAGFPEVRDHQLYGDGSVRWASGEGTRFMNDPTPNVSMQAYGNRAFWLRP